MTGVEVRRANADDWQAVRAVRLQALADSPAAFGATLDHEISFTTGEWRQRTQTGHWYLAWYGDQPVGIAAGVAGSEMSDEGELVAMWVAPEQRGTTAAGRLVEAVCRWAAEQGAAAVGLWVADGNPRARHFYERLGFTATGDREAMPGRPSVGKDRLRRNLTS